LSLLAVRGEWHSGKLLLDHASMQIPGMNLEGRNIVYAAGPDSTLSGDVLISGNPQALAIFMRKLYAPTLPSLTGTIDLAVNLRGTPGTPHFDVRLTFPALTVGVSALRNGFIKGNKIKKTYYFYDGLGRLKQTQTRVNDTSIIVISLKYDSLGRKEKETKSYNLTASFGTYQAPNWTSLESQEFVIKYEYDFLDRVTKITNPDGTNITKAYSDNENKVKITDENGHWKDYYYDTFDNLISVEEQQT
jgi:YD repeat-containing protein